MELREVDLPVCDICGRVGAQPGTPRAPKRGQVRFTCNGGRENPHKAERMRIATFREVR